MRSEDGHIAGLRIRVVEWDVLFHSEVQRLFLLVGCGGRILAKVLARHDMLDDSERRR
jgi:hypothetical protein